MTILRIIAVSSVIVTTWAEFAYAGTATGLFNFQVDRSNITLNMTGQESPSVPCNTLHLFVAKASGAFGKNIVDTINSAAAGGLTVTAIGAGKCTIFPGAEDLAGVGIMVAGSKSK